MLNPLSVGIGLRAPHYPAVLAEQLPLDFLEVHSENFFHAGGAALRTLEAVRTHYRLSLHGVGLSLGSADGLRDTHLAQLATLVERTDPVLVSEHLCWGAVDQFHAADLLPIPTTYTALTVFCTHVEVVQEKLGRQILIENISAYLRFRDVDMTECEFLAELAQRSGCGILLDVNNLYVNAQNFAFDPYLEMRKLPATAIQEIHLAGHSEGEHGLIDTHGSLICDGVWSLYRDALSLFGPVPTLIERDTNIPPVSELLDEVTHARKLIDETRKASYA